MRKRCLLGTVALSAVLILALSLVPSVAAAPAPPTWTRIASAGVVNPNNVFTRPGVEFQGKLAIGAQVYPLVPVPVPPVSLCLYDSSTFTKVGADGLGDNYNVELFPTAVFQGKLYIGTGKAADPADPNPGAQLYTWDGTGNPAIVGPSTGGWGEGANTNRIMPLGVLNDKLYVCAWDISGPPAGGFRLYSFDGTTWVEVVGPAAPVNRGLGDPSNLGATWFGNTVFDGKLLLALNNPTTGLQVYTYDGTNFVQIGAAGVQPWAAAEIEGTVVSSPSEGKFYLGTGTALGAATGGGIYSYDGTNWAQLATAGIDDVNNDFLQPLLIGQDLYAGAWNAATGCRVYQMEGANFTAISAVSFDGAAPPTNLTAAIASYNGQLLGFTENAAGSEVWSSATLSTTYYFAEGTTRNNAADGMYEEWICLQNSHGTDAHVLLTYMFSDGTTQDQHVTVAKTSRMTISVNAAVGADRDVSTKVESDLTILAERPMYFNYRNKWTGGHNVMGLPGPRMSYYFAEGTTRGNAIDGYFEQWFSIQNPGASDATVTIDYMLETGATVQKQYPLAKTSRRTVDVNLDVGPNHDVSATITSDEPIVAERPMYFNYHDKWIGGHNVVGSPDAGTTFYFAEGTTRDNAVDGVFEEWISIQNPGNTDANVTVTYYTAQAGTQNQAVNVPATSRQTVDVKLRLGADVDTSFKIESDQPVLVERPMYFNYHNAWAGGHNVMGCSVPKRNFYFAEGTTRPEFNTWLAVVNTGTAQAHVTFNYLLGDGSTQVTTVNVAPNQRYTRDVATDVGLNQDVSVVVYADQPIVAERPMYFGYHGWCPGGSDTLGYGI